MKIFAQLVRTAVNVALLPVAVVKDVVTLGNLGEHQTHTQEAIERLKDEAEEDD